MAAEKQCRQGNSEARSLLHNKLAEQSVPEEGQNMRPAPCERAGDTSIMTAVTTGSLARTRLTFPSGPSILPPAFAQALLVGHLRTTHRSACLCPGGRDKKKTTLSSIERTLALHSSPSPMREGAPSPGSPWLQSPWKRARVGVGFPTAFSRKGSDHRV